MFAVPYLALIVDTSTGLSRYIFNAVGQGNHFPVPVIKVGRFCTCNGSFVESPCRIHGIYFTSGVCQFIETGSREFRLVGCLHLIEREK